MRIFEMNIKYDGDPRSLRNNYATVRLADIDYIDRGILNQCAIEGRSFTIVPKDTVDIKVIKVIHHNPATIVFWSDGTKTVVKCDKNDTYDPEKGFYIACTKKLFGNDYKAGGRINKALEMAVTKGDLK